MPRANAAGMSPELDERTAIHPFSIQKTQPRRSCALCQNLCWGYVIECLYDWHRHIHAHNMPCVHWRRRLAIYNASLRSSNSYRSHTAVVVGQLRRKTGHYGKSAICVRYPTARCPILTGQREPARCARDYGVFAVDPPSSAKCPLHPAP